MPRSIPGQVIRLVFTALLTGSLLLVPVQCHLVDGHHSLFDIPDALKRHAPAMHEGHHPDTAGADAGRPVPGMLWARDVVTDPGNRPFTPGTVSTSPLGVTIATATLNGENGTMPVVQPATMVMGAAVGVAISTAMIAIVLRLVSRRVWFRVPGVLTDWRPSPTCPPPRAFPPVGIVAPGL